MRRRVKVDLEQERGKLLPYLRSTKTLRPWLDAMRHSPREAAIVVGTLFDGLLELLLRKRFVPDTTKELFEGFGPLSSLSAKIELAAALGLIAKREQQELHQLRRIRNEFAHSLNAHSDFDTPRIKSLVFSLELGRMFTEGERANDPRWRFEVTVLIMVGFLLGQERRTRHAHMRRDPVEGLQEHRMRSRTGPK